MPNYIGRTEKWTWFGYAPAREATPPYLARWKYFRAPEGMVIELLGISISGQISGTKDDGIIQLYLGHKRPSIYGMYPHIEDQDVLFRAEVTGSASAFNRTHDLFGYDVKQFTVAVRSTTESYEFRPCIIIFFRYRKFIDEREKLEYAVKQPKLKKSKGLGQLNMVTR